MAQGKDRAASGQGDLLGFRGQVGQVGEGVKDLPGIAEGRIEQRNVPYPDGSEPKAVDFADKIGLACKYAQVALIKA
ncbi:hypothetical protein D3C77_396110 [compost metagenome]